jgi:hypothetical protein
VLCEDERAQVNVVGSAWSLAAGMRGRCPALWHEIGGGDVALLSTK